MSSLCLRYLLFTLNPRYLRLLVFTASISFIFLLLNPFATFSSIQQQVNFPQVSWLKIWTQEGSKASSVDCDAFFGDLENRSSKATGLMELLNRRRNPNFWALSSDLKYPQKYLITPRVSVTSELISECVLSDALFSTKLVSLLTNFTMLLPSPRLILPSTYEFTITSDILETLPKGNYFLEATLENSYLPGATEGSVCGEGASNCNVQQVGVQLAQKGVFWNNNGGSKYPTPKDVGLVGEAIPDRLELNFEEPHNPLPDLRLKLCKNFSSLPGYLMGTDYHPFNLVLSSHTPCTLTDPSKTPPPLFSTTDNIRPIRWLNFIGDSNTFNLFTSTLNSIGITKKPNVFRHTVYDYSIKRNRTISKIAFRSSVDSSALIKDCDLVLTWTYWEQTWNLDQWEHNIDYLRKVVQGKLLDFTKDRSFNEEGFTENARTRLVQATTGIEGKGEIDLRPERTFISLGSHSVTQTAEATGHYLDLLFSSLTKDILEDSNVRFFPTSLVRSALIPQKKHPLQDLVVNNAIISAKNQRLFDRTETRGRVLDITGLTGAATTKSELMKRGSDYVHFVDGIYTQWSNILWTEWVVNGNSKD